MYYILILDQMNLKILYMIHQLYLKMNYQKHLQYITEHKVYTTKIYFNYCFN